jgi:hypothetical protein
VTQRLLLLAAAPLVPEATAIVTIGAPGSSRAVRLTKFHQSTCFDHRR